MIYKNSLFIAVLSATVLLFASHLTAHEKDEDGFVTIFNGKDLTGWDANPEIWSVENGMLVGQRPSVDPQPRQDYIYWAEAEPGDFILRLKYRLHGEQGNSGIQIRSERRPNRNAYGYQADIEAGPRWTGCLFHHSRGGIVMRGYKGIIHPDGTSGLERFADPEELAKKYTTVGEWNEYEISAVGSVITLKINGELMAQVDDRHERAAKAGIIAFQMYQRPMRIEFKNIRIKILDKE